MPNPPKITHFIFDMDGILLNTEHIYTTVTDQVLKKFGKSFDWKIKSQMIGRKSHDAAAILIQALDLPLTPDAFLNMQKSMFQEAFPKTEPMKGAEALTAYLLQNKIPHAVATSSTRYFFDLKTTAHQKWFSGFDVIITGDDPQVKHGKPAPDIFQLAAERMGAAPENCLVFEDAPSGVEAALAANMQVIAVPDPHMNRDQYPQPHQFLDSLEAFQPEKWGLPTANSGR